MTTSEREQVLAAICEKIGSLTDRLSARVGRSMGACRTCGKQTRSHVVGDGRQCHTCHESGKRVLAADGGREADTVEDDTGSPRARIERYFVDNPEAGVTDALGGLTLSPVHHELVEEVRAGRDGDDSDVPEETHRASAVSDEADDPEREPGGSDGSGLYSPVKAGIDDTNPGFKGDESDAREHSDPERAREAFATLVEWFHDHLDDAIGDHAEQNDGDHHDRPTTARAYFREVREWTDETIDDNRLGWAPPDDGAAFDHLLEAGFDPETARATGVFNKNDELLWQGRYVLPYFDADGEPVYAIARCTGDAGGGAAGYDGHPADYLAGKYAKVAHSRDDVPLTEPIWGMHTLRDGAPVVVAEGIADAITAHAAGYAVLSPVAKEFKHDHFDPLLDAIETHDVERVYVLPDSERAGFGWNEDAPDDTEHIRDAINIPKAAPGPAGGRRTVRFLADEGVDARYVGLPLPAESEGFHKVDLDDYLHEWSDDLGAVMRSARRPHPDDESESTPSADDTGFDREDDGAGEVGEEASDLWTLELTDLTYAALSDAGDRGKNPLGHTGDSENYFVIREGADGDLVGRDYKRPGEPVYNALTYLLVDAGERSISNPEGSLSDREVWVAWKQARERGDLGDGDPMPRAALCYLAVEHDHCERDDIKDGWKLPRDAYNAVLDTVEDEYGLTTGREHLDRGASGQQYGAKTCAPPTYDPEEFDHEQRWDELQGERYEAYLRATGPHVWADPPGVGKSTNAERAAAQRDRPYFVGFDKHEKGREAITDDATPDEQYHLKGAEQPRENCCMDAAAAADEGETPHCPEHGHPSDWPRMCPIYERAQDDLLRQRFEALVGPLGTLGTHLKLGLFDEDEHPWHGSHAGWSEQFDHLLDDEGRPLAERVVGVHEYQLLKSATERRDVIVDESPRTLATEQRVDVDDLLRAQARLEQLAEIHRSDDDSALSDNLAALATFGDELAHAIACDDAAAFADLDTPGVQPVTFDRPVDPDDLPAEVAPEEVERTTWREYQGTNSEHYVEHDRYVAPTEVYDEPLAQVKLAYNEGLVSRIQQTDDELPSASFCIDALFAAAGKAGLPTADVRRAVAVPPVLDDCPWCGSALDAENGARVCASDECDWDERENTITQQDGEKARASAWLDDDPNDLDAGERPALVSGRLPSVEDLPDDPLILDATATPEKVAGLYGASMSDVEVRGDGHLDLDGRLNVTQVLDGQYHANTIRQSETAKERIQNVIETALDTHNKPLFGIRRDLIPLFEFAGTEGEDYELLVYGGARGLNRTECDAVVCIGAPHPDMNDIQRQAELLAMDRDDLRAGGEEYSTRRNAPNAPIYRKLLYEDEHGDGLAVPTKAYSGVAGALFREAREKELEQFVHRTRPLLNDSTTDDPVDAYLLTNVPTDLPVDDVCRFEELADDLSALFPVPEGGIELLGYGRDVLAGNGPDGFRDEALVEERDDGTLANKVAGWHRLAQLNGMDVTERTVRNWIDALESTGLLTAENYEHRVGVSYTTDVSTLKSALQVLSSNAGFKVAAVRRLATKIRESDGALDWLEWAESVFTLSGDRCGWDPPPNPGG